LNDAMSPRDYTNVRFSAHWCCHETSSALLMQPQLEVLCIVSTGVD
jgi:hypothetical protein